MAKWDFDYYDLPPQSSINLHALCEYLTANMACKVIYDPMIYAGINVKVPLHYMAGYTHKELYDERYGITLAKEKYDNFRRFSKLVMDDATRKKECKRQRQDIRNTEKNHLSLATILIWASGKGTLVLPWAAVHASCRVEVATYAVHVVQKLHSMIGNNRAKLVHHKVKVSMATRPGLKPNASAT